jgi:hypothetical protein
MSIIARLKLWWAEEKLNVGAFGKYNRYRRWCIERNAMSSSEKLAIANEVLSGLCVGVMEAQANELFLSRHRDEMPQP